MDHDLLSFDLKSKMWILVFEIFRKRKDNASGRDHLAIFHCFITYIILKYMDLREFLFLQPDCKKRRQMYLFFKSLVY